MVASARVCSSVARAGTTETPRNRSLSCARFYAMVKLIMAYKSKKCRHCGKRKKLDKFYKATLRKKNSVYKVARVNCKPCHLILTKGESIWRVRLQKYRRRAAICTLDVPFLKWAFKQPCQYCLRSGRDMSLDRAIPALGYTKDNSIPSCITCNQIKSDMSPEAWAIILPAVREAINRGFL
jgi:hypothetical protein